LGSERAGLELEAAFGRVSLLGSSRPLRRAAGGLGGQKDTPLWAPDEEPIYYWSADEYDEEKAWYVPYTGGGRYGGAISYQPKDWGNPRHGYRCVRE